MGWAALGLMDSALQAAREAERMADPLNEARFAMLTASIQARGVTKELRRGGKAALDTDKHRSCYIHGCHSLMGNGGYP